MGEFYLQDLQLFGCMNLCLSEICCLSESEQLSFSFNVQSFLIDVIPPVVNIFFYQAFWNGNTIQSLVLNSHTSHLNLCTGQFWNWFHFWATHRRDKRTFRQCSLWSLSNPHPTLHQMVRIVIEISPSSTFGLLIVNLAESGSPTKFPCR